MSTKQIAVCYFFASSSGSGQYQTLQYTDAATSCECPGWVRRVAPDGSRSCKHTRTVESGQGAREAVKVVEYSGKPIARELQPTRISRPESKPKFDRVFNFET